MRAVMVWLVAAVSLSGCRAPMPSMKDFSPYGATRIEPPRTGAFGAADSYYQPPAALGSTAPANARSSIESADLDQSFAQVAAAGDASSSDDNLQWTAGPTRSTPARAGNGIAAASHEEPLPDSPDGSSLPMATLTVLPPRSPSRTLSSTASATAVPRGTTSPQRGTRTGTTIEFDGMPVNDATALVEPAAFNEPADARDIAELPEPSPALRSQLPTRLAGSNEPSRAFQPSSSAVTSSGWKTR